MINLLFLGYIIRSYNASVTFCDVIVRAFWYDVTLNDGNVACAFQHVYRYFGHVRVFKFFRCILQAYFGTSVSFFYHFSMRM